MKKVKIFAFFIIIIVSALVFVSCAFPSPMVTDTAEPSKEITSSVPASEPPAQTESPVTPSPEPVKIQLAGDILLHGKPVKSAKTGDATYDFNPFFSDITPYINGDLAICNIEMPIDVKGGNKELSSYPMFNAPYEILEAVKKAGFNFFVNANNHSFDKGWDGLLVTKENIRKAGVASVGTYASREEYDTYTVLDIKGFKIGILAYTDALNGLETLVPKEKRDYAVRRFSSSSLDSLPSMLEDIEGCRAAGAEFVIVSLHWGAEYVNAPTGTQKEIARALCAGGADVIMGNHSHCVQPVEWLDGAEGKRSLCVYSLGNFFADQNDMENPIRKTQYGMLISMMLERDEKGRAVIGSADILPTFICRYSSKESPTGVSYALLPSGETPDEWFSSESDLKRCKEAFAHVTGITGTDFISTFR